jgi:hypothetical protein
LLAIQQNPDTRLGDYVSEQEICIRNKPVFAGAERLKERLKDLDFRAGTKTSSPQIGRSRGVLTYWYAESKTSKGF